MPLWHRGTRDILSYIPAVAVPWKGTHRSAENPLYPLDPCSFCHLEPPIVVISSLSRDLFFICPFLAHSEKSNQKRGATPKAPFKGGCKRESRTTDDSRAFLVSRDTRCLFFSAGAWCIRSIRTIRVRPFSADLRGTGIYHVMMRGIRNYILYAYCLMSNE